MKIAVSILSIKDDTQKIKEVEYSSADYMHLDIMDGKFVSNVAEMYREYIKPLDVHLMVSDVREYIDKYKDLNPVYITFHYEATTNIKEVIDYIHGFGIKTGISISPETEVDKIIPYLPYIDLVLVMSVVPGEGEQLFIPSSVDKINELYDIRNNYSYNYVIEVDGGINNETLKLVEKADIAVIGSYITKKDNYECVIQELKRN